jgi:hypothetical protein
MIEFECGVFSGMDGRRNRSTRRKPAKVPLYRPQIALEIYPGRLPLVAGGQPLELQDEWLKRKRTAHTDQKGRLCWYPYYEYSPHFMIRPAAHVYCSCYPCMQTPRRLPTLSPAQFPLRRSVLLQLLECGESVFLQTATQMDLLY